MSKATKGVAWMRDLVEVLFFDRLHPQRKRLSEEASTAARTLRFHSRARIAQVPLAEVLQLLSCPAVEQVTLPGPQADLGDVGSQTYYHALASLVRGLQPRVVLEFGTYLGVSAHTMAMNAPPDCRIFTIDLPDDAVGQDVPELNAIDHGHIVRSRRRVGEAFVGTATEKQITQILADSMAFHAENCVPSADLVFVDGGHSLPVVSKDTENAFRILAPQGTILWDDYFHLYPDVVKFLDDLQQRCVLYGIAGTNFVVYSPRWQKS